MVAHGGRRDPPFGCNPFSGPPLELQGCDPVKNALRDAAVQPVGSRGPVLKAISPLGPETCDPLTDSRPGDSEGVGSIFHGRSLLEHAARQLFSTIRRQSGILLGVPSALLGVGSFWKCQHSRSGPNGQQPICSSHLGSSARLVPGWTSGTGAPDPTLPEPKARPSLYTDRTQRVGLCNGLSDIPGTSRPVAGLDPPLQRAPASQQSQGQGIHQQTWLKWQQPCRHPQLATQLEA